MSATLKGRAGLPPLPAELANRAVFPDDRGYAMVRSSYMAAGSPAVVIMATTADEVAAAVRYAADAQGPDGERLPVAVRSGGHGIAGTSTNHGGIIIDLSRLDAVDLDPDAHRVRAQAGAGWGKVSTVLAPHDLTITSGNFGDTGVGGLATAGGVGYFARSQGLTIDRVRAAQLVTADGRVRWVDAEHEPDLFWAVRGGGTHVGIVTEVELEPTRMNTRSGDASIIYQEVGYAVTDLGAFTQAWGEWIDGAPRAAEGFLMLNATGSGRTIVRARNVWAGDDTAAATPVLEAALGLGQVFEQQAFITPYPQIVPSPGQPHLGQQAIRMRDVLVDRADAEVGRAMAQALADRTTLLGEIRALGGAVSDVDPSATAWAGRHQRALVGTWLRPAGTVAEDASFAPLQQLGTGTYAAYSSDVRPASAELAWPGDTGTRLRALSEQVDPEGLFTQGHSLRRR
ncbi:FAD-binding oxidoreductase [Tessaracoccus lubricantis]|uniref:FAD-binding oxidoreductase n=1 Tax=Tessaracoccus lubricantis TaxID=545543 RepID=A0ABP9EZN6_9ACTN